MSMKIIQFSRSPTPLVHLSPKLYHPLQHGRPVSINSYTSPPPPPPSYVNDNQSAKRKQNPRMTIVCYEVLPSGQLLFSVSTHQNCLVFHLTSFHLAEASLSTFSWLHTHVYVQWSKISQIVFYL